METVKNILVVSRLTPYCEEAVEFGVSLAKKFDATLQVLYLVSNPVDMEAVNAPGLVPGEQTKNYRSFEEESKDELDKTLRAQHATQYLTKTQVRSGAAPAEEIRKVVSEERIDLMLMQVEEQGKLEHMLFGKETDTIIRSMPCSILLVKKELTGVEW